MLRISTTTVSTIAVSTDLTNSNPADAAFGPSPWTYKSKRSCACLCPAWLLPNQARTTSGTSTAWTSRLRITSPGMDLTASLPRLIADEEEVGDQQDEQAVLDDDVAADRLLDGVPDDPAVHVPEQEEHDREHALC